MHYPLHITLVLASLAILRDDVNAAKSGLSAEVLTSFAKNVASVLSTTLLNNYQDPQTNQTSFTLLKKIHDPQSSLRLDLSQSEDSDNSPTIGFNRFSRFTRQGVSPNGEKEAYQNPYIIDQSQYAKYDNLEAYKPYPYSLNSDALTNYNQINVAAPENTNNGANRNSIEADVKAASLHYTNQYNYPRGFEYKREPVPSLPNPNHYPPFAVQPQYRHLPSEIPANQGEHPAGVDTLNPNEVESDNAQAARITRRPYHLNYPGPIHSPYNPSFPTQPEFYPDDRPIQGEDRPVAPINDEDQNNPSRLVVDQNQGQTAFGAYGYGPGFHYKPPYHGGFYDGYPGFYTGPFNGSFHQGNPEQGNGTAGPYPYGPPPFHDPKFGPYYPYNQPFYPNFHGNERPAEPQNPENQGYMEQIPVPENGNGNVNGTGYGPPFGFAHGPPYGPYYGGHSGYPLVPFNGFPYRVGYGFHDHLYPRIKVGPYLNFYPGHYQTFPLVPYYPFGGYYPYNNKNHNKPVAMPDKPEETDKVTNDNAEAAAPPANEDVEMLAESKSDTIRATSTNGGGKTHSPEFVAKVNVDVARNRSSEFDRSP